MTSRYQSTFSINQDKYFFKEGVGGCYIDETGHSIIFLDDKKDILVENAFQKLCISCGEENIPYWVGDHDTENLVFPNEKQKEVALRKYRRERSGYRSLKGEQEVIKKIIITDFHEFIHHFLYENKIPNNCCDERLHAYDHEDPGSGRCWLCDFTHKLSVKVAPTKNYGQYPELLHHFHTITEEHQYFPENNPGLSSNVENVEVVKI